MNEAKGNRKMNLTQQIKDVTMDLMLGAWVDIERVKELLAEANDNGVDAEELYEMLDESGIRINDKKEEEDVFGDDGYVCLDKIKDILECEGYRVIQTDAEDEIELTPLQIGYILQ